MLALVVASDRVFAYEVEFGVLHSLSVENSHQQVCVQPVRQFQDETSAVL